MIEWLRHACVITEMVGDEQVGVGENARVQLVTLGLVVVKSSLAMVSSTIGMLGHLAS